jgi:hypothetical protein
MRAVSHSDELPDAGGELPAFVERAREDARCRAVLARMGYRRVKRLHARQPRSASGSDLFRGLEDEMLWPTIDMVGDWLKEEKKRTGSHVRWTFFAAMLVTIAIALTFTAGLTFFN